MARISRDKMFIGIAELYAQRGTCDRAQVGAVLVNRDHRIISTGYNGSPSGEDHCDDVGHLMKDGHCVRTIHAEENCIEYLARGLKHVALGCTLYVTHSPCINCAKIILHRSKRIGIDRIVYLHKYSDDGINLLRGGGITVEQYTE